MRRVATIGFIGLATVALAVAGCGGKGQDAAKPKAKAEEKKAEAGKAAETPKEAPKPRSEFDDLREGLKDYVTLLADCDKAWFAKVDPDKIDKWELPVDVKTMEPRCDPLLNQYEKLMEKGAFRSPVMDEFLRTSALAADRYLLLAFRCKKVGVRDKVPYKKELAELRDALRADVAKLKEDVAKVLALSDAQLQVTALPPADTVKWADGTLQRIKDDFKAWVQEPRKVENQKPTWRYSLRTGALMATRAAAALKLASTATPEGLADPAQALADAYQSATTFFTGDYFEKEEEQGPKVYKEMAKADTAYRNAARKALAAKRK